jgi:hypothetical protein
LGLLGLPPNIMPEEYDAHLPGIDLALEAAP